MKIASVFDDEFRPYGRVVEGVDPALVSTLAEALAAHARQPEAGAAYVPDDPQISGLPEAAALAPVLFGGLPTQFGWVAGHNRSLNCLEYHRTSEFNMGTEDFVLLLAKQDQVVGETLDTDCVRAFRAPAGKLIEVYATTLHYTPCQVSDAGFHVLVALPKGTNEPFDGPRTASDEAPLLWATNKWLLAHEESDEAARGANVALYGDNVTLD